MLITDDMPVRFVPRFDVRVDYACRICKREWTITFGGPYRGDDSIITTCETCRLIKRKELAFNAHLETLRIEEEK